MKKIIDNHEIWSRSFYWKPPASASMRRNKEFDINLSFNLRGDLYEINQSLTCSSRNYNYRLTVHLNKSKKDIRLLKSFFEGQNND